jgi:hypothetical protein
MTVRELWAKIQDMNDTGMDLSSELKMFDDSTGGSVSVAGMVRDETGITFVSPDTAIVMQDELL